MTNTPDAYRPPTNIEPDAPAEIATPAVEASADLKQGRLSSLRVAIGVTGAALTLVTGLVKVAEYVNESDIVAGVPAQVETHSWSRYSGYALGIEQCPSDIEAAKQGQPTSSFDPAVGEVYVACNYDTVSVGEATWQQYADGATITFPGSPTHHLPS
jgi:hypothetical protein